jgi:hypothetical protein
MSMPSTKLQETRRSSEDEAKCRRQGDLKDRAGELLDIGQHVARPLEPEPMDSSASAGWLARWTEREKPLRAIRWTPTGSRAQLAIVPAGALGAQPEIFHDHFVETEEDTDVCGSVAFLFRGSSLVEGRRLHYPLSIQQPGGGGPMMLSRLRASPGAIAIAEWEPFALRPKIVHSRRSRQGRLRACHQIARRER